MRLRSTSTLSSGPITTSYCSFCCTSGRRAYVHGISLHLFISPISPISLSPLHSVAHRANMHMHYPQSTIHRTCLASHSSLLLLSLLHVVGPCIRAVSTTKRPSSSASVAHRNPQLRPSGNSLVASRSQRRWRRIWPRVGNVKQCGAAYAVATYAVGRHSDQVRVQ